MHNVFFTYTIRRASSFGILYPLIGLALVMLMSLCMAPQRTLAQQDNTRDSVKAEANAVAPAVTLTAVQDRDEKGKPWQATFDFGTVDLLDSSIADQDYRDSMDNKPVLEGIKHIFVLKNNTKKPIVIARDRTNCGCTQTKVWGEEVFKRFPYTVEPGAEVKIITAILQDALAPGPVSITVDLLGVDRQVVASLTMTDKIDSGVNLSKSILDFDHVRASTSTSQQLILTLNRKIPVRLPPGAVLRLTSSNPYVQVTNIPPIEAITGIKVEGDTISFPNEQGKELPKDIVLNFRVDLLKTAPLGPVGGKLQLIVPGFPVFMLVDSAKAQLKGEVVGHMKADPLNVVSLGTVPQGKEAKGSVNITVMAPLSLDDLRVSSANPNLSAKFIPAASAKSLDAGSTAGLEVTLNSTAPPGRIFDKVIVTNVKNDERLEINVYATVIK